MTDDARAWESAAHRRRRAVRLDLEDPRDRRPSAARAPRRAPDHRLALRADAPRRRRFRLAHGSPGLDREPPTIGEHSDEILKEAGYGAEEIAQLRQARVIWQRDDG